MPEQIKFEIVLRIQSRLDHVRLVRAAMTGVLSHLRVVEADTHALELAVTEIVNNCFEHAYQGREDRHIEVAISALDYEVQIAVIDGALAFPEEHRHRLLDRSTPFQASDEEWSVRGHGLQIVQQIVDSITLERVNAKNILVLKKTVALQPD